MSLYFIALVPPIEIEVQLKALKSELKERYNLRRALRLPAHITLQKPFNMVEVGEERLLKTLESFARKEKIFPIKLKDFGAFPTKVIYVKVLENQALELLFKGLQDALKTLLPKKELMGGGRFHPHVTIAYRDLKKELFPEVWKTFRERSFHASWEAEELVLFKHDGKNWSILGTFQLKRK